MRLRHMLLGAVAALLLTSCTKAAVPSAKGDVLSSIEEVPSFEAYTQLPPGEKLRMRLGLEGIPVDSCDAYFTEMIQEFLQDEELTSFRGISIEQDHLTLIPGKNNKSLINLVFHIDLEMDTTKVIDNCEIADDVSDRLIEHLNRDTFYWLKAEHCTISTYDLNGYKIRTSQRGTSTVNEILFVEQPEAEYAAQSAAYSFTEKNPEFSLNQFGAVPEANELFARFYVKDDYFGWGEKENKQAMDGLEAVSSDIAEYLLEDRAVKGYMEESGLDILTLSFQSGFFDEGDWIVQFVQ